jgi:hypothetical protein
MKAVKAVRRQSPSVAFPIFVVIVIFVVAAAAAAKTSGTFIIIIRLDISVDYII